MYRHRHQQINNSILLLLVALVLTLGTSFFLHFHLALGNPNATSIPVVSLFRHDTSIHASLHNSTVEGIPIPGPFFDGRVYLAGARLSFHQRDDNWLRFQVLGLTPKPFYYRRSDKACRPNHLNHTLLTYDDLIDRFDLHVQLATGALIPLQHVPTHLSVDSNQNRVSILWEADLSTYIRPKDLLMQPLDAVLRVELHAKAMIDNIPRHYQVTFDVPVSTGVIGHAGPQIGRQRSLQKTTRVDSKHAVLCVGIYGLSAQRYLPEFMEHHLHLGFDNIILGIDTYLGSDELKKASELLHSYIQDGFLQIAAIGLRDLDCAPDVQRVPFNQACLDHARGVAPYVGVWDIDEYWMPPVKLPNGRDCDKDMIQDSKPCTVTDVMHAIQQYHADQECEKEYCYHSFPSRLQYLRRDTKDSEALPDTDRSQWNWLDFGVEDDKVDLKWAKSILLTDRTFQSGIHVPGSCKFHGTTGFAPIDSVRPFPYLYNVTHVSASSDDGSSEQQLPRCHNIRSGLFGEIYHFASLMRMREREDGYESTFATSRYVSLYAHEVQKRLQARNVVHQL